MTRAEQQEVRELQAVIEAFTKRKVVSHSLTYLRHKASMLRASHADARGGERDFDVDPMLVMFFGERRARLVVTIAARKGVAVGALLARAFDELAVREGFGVEVERMKR